MRATTSNSFNVSILRDRALTFRNPGRLHCKLFVSVIKLSAFTPDALCCDTLRQRVITDRMLSTPRSIRGMAGLFSFLVPLRVVFALVALLTTDKARHSLLMSTCLGDMICLSTLGKLARNTQVASSYATTCIGRTAILRAAAQYRRPSASRPQHTAAPCVEGRLARPLRRCFGGLSLVDIDVMQPLCEEAPRWAPSSRCLLAASERLPINLFTPQVEKRTLSFWKADVSHDPSQNRKFWSCVLVCADRAARHTDRQSHTLPYSIDEHNSTGE